MNNFLNQISRPENLREDLEEWKKILEDAQDELEWAEEIVVSSRAERRKLTQGVNTRVGVTGNKPARAWILTVAAHCFTPYQPDGVKYIRGQLESSESGFLHWQVRS